MANGRYRVRVYAADSKAKSGRKIANKNQNGGTSLVSALRSLADAVEKQGDNASRVVRVLIDQELPSENGTAISLDLSEPAAEATDAPASPAPAAPAPATPTPGGKKSGK